MIQLSIQTAEKEEGFGIFDDGEILSIFYLDGDKNVNDSLAGKVAFELERLKIEAGAIELISIVAGPGSFTGLKIGMVFAKGLARGGDVPIALVNSLEALAYNAKTDGKIITMMDARNERAFYQEFIRDGDTVSSRGEVEVDEIKKILKGQKEVTLVGSAAENYRKQIEKFGTFNYAKSNQINLEMVAKIGHRQFKSGDVVNHFHAKPQYGAKPNITLKK